MTCFWIDCVIMLLAVSGGNSTLTLVGIAACIIADIFIVRAKKSDTDKSAHNVKMPLRTEEPVRGYVNCPNCGAKAPVRGLWWECPWCGNSGKMKNN